MNFVSFVEGFCSADQITQKLIVKLLTMDQEEAERITPILEKWKERNGSAEKLRGCLDKIL